MVTKGNALLAVINSCTRLLTATGGFLEIVFRAFLIPLRGTERIDQALSIYAHLTYVSIGDRCSNAVGDRRKKEKLRTYIEHVSVKRSSLEGTRKPD
jgi:hypothetical protein